MIRNNHIGSNSGWYIFYSASFDQFWLGIRTHDLGGTDYDYIHKVTHAEAKTLRDHGHDMFGVRIWELYNYIDNHKPKPTKEELLTVASRNVISAWQSGCGSTLFDALSELDTTLKGNPE